MIEKKKYKFVWASAIFLLLVVNLEYGYAQGPPIFTDTPIMLGLEGRGVRTFGRYISRENVEVYVQPFAHRNF